MLAQKTIRRRQVIDSSVVDQLSPEIHPVLRRVFHNRGMFHPVELQHGLNELLPPTRLMGVDDAVAVLVRTLKARQPILIVGDFDADGATATALAILGLRALGALEVDYLVPNRFEYGYGLSAEIAKLAIERSPGLVITVDNGITSIDGVALLKDAGTDVIVTDHHLAGEHLPRADAIVNPNQPGCDFPSKALAGVGVLFYLLLALRTRLRSEGWFAERGVKPPNLAVYLDLVALGTVADLVPLDRNNRILVAQGVARIESGVCRPGILKLLQVAGRDPGRAVTSDLGFVLGPRLNAAGRLEDISTGIECLLAEEDELAGQLAAQLQGINQQRRQIEQQMQQQALAALSALDRDGQVPLEDGICLYDESWHQGVTGLVASRIKERTDRPVVAFAPGNGEELKGSARSIPQLHIRDVLAAIDAKIPGLIQRFGGHAMAAGLSIAPSDYDNFKQAFQNGVRSLLGPMSLKSELLTDGELAKSHYTLHLAEVLRCALPWGQGCPAPRFDGFFDVKSQRIVGGQHLKLMLRPQKSSEMLNGIAFRYCAPGDPVPELRKIRAVYQLDVNEFRGRRSVQLVIDYIESCADDQEE